MTGKIVIESPSLTSEELKDVLERILEFAENRVGEGWPLPEVHRVQDITIKEEK